MSSKSESENIQKQQNKNSTTRNSNNSRGRVYNTPLERRFLESIHELYKKKQRGELAYLKRAINKTIGESSKASSVFYQLLPAPLINSKYEELYFLVATLLAYYPESYSNNIGSFGKTVKYIDIGSKTEGIKRRFIALLDSDLDEIEYGVYGGGALAHRLTQMVKLARSKDVKIDWHQLLYDLKYWRSESRFVQKKWSRDYFGRESDQSQAEQT